MASNSSRSCSSRSAVGYSAEQAMSLVTDDQSPNLLAADSDNGEEFAQSVDNDFVDNSVAFIASK